MSGSSRDRLRIRCVQARLSYLNHSQAKIDKVRHPGVLKTDVAAFAAGWSVDREHLRQLQAEAEAERLRQRQRDEDEAAEHERRVREELLPDRYAEPEDVERAFELYPELRGYTPPPEHFRAVDLRHVKRALYEIQREGCPPAIKQEQRRRLEELEQIWPGIVDEFKRSSATADDTFRYDARKRQSNRRVDSSDGGGVAGYRLRAAQAVGVSSASRWMEMSARPGSTAAR